MALVQREFSPSRAKGRLRRAKRSQHIMLAGGREGPEVADKPPRTSRYSESGSSSWTSDLAAGITSEDARTQPPFLRAVVGGQRAYARGLMTVKESVDTVFKAYDYAQENTSYDPVVEFTGATVDGGLASFTGRVLIPMVDTVSQQASTNWVQTLKSLAEELRLIQAQVRRPPDKYDIALFAFTARVYLHLKSPKGRQLSIPVEQLTVIEPTGSGIYSASNVDVAGVYAPTNTDPEVKFGGTALKIGDPVRVPALSVDYVTVDPPEMLQEAFMETPAYARSRGFVIELTPAEMARTRSTEARFTVPYDRVLRVRMIYPPAEGYERQASRAVENEDSVQRELEAAKRHLKTIRDELAFRALSRLSFKDKTISVTDKVSGFRFSLEDTSIGGATNPVLIWDVIVQSDDQGKRYFIPPQGEYSLVGRRVTAIDYLRLLRSARSERSLRELRRLNRRRSR